MEIIDFKIVIFSHYDHHYGGESLESKVKKEIEDGWRPLGSPFPWDTGDKLALAMVKEAPFKPIPIKEHVILKSPDLDELEAMVADRIARGWHTRHPVGHIDGLFIQVMVRI